jgi:hypothetical protein
MVMGMSLETFTRLHVLISLVAIISGLVVLAGKAYVISAVIALYFNCFVLVVQSFEKVPQLHALAPTQNEPPFAIAQLGMLIVFVALGVIAVKRFHPDALAASTRAATL